MDYEHDIFISYRREKHWTKWTRDLFRPLLKSFLQQDLGQSPKIFVDEQIEVGSDWVEDLATHLARSKVVVAIFTGDYFDSPWCLHELDLMIERQQAVAEKPATLLVPLIAHDGDLIPEVVKRIQHGDISEFHNPYLDAEAKKCFEFCETLKKLSPQIARLIKAAPPFDVSWVEHHKQRFNGVYEANLRGEILPTGKFAVRGSSASATSHKLNPRMR